MAISFITGIVFVILAAAGFVFAFVNFDEQESKRGTIFLVAAIVMVVCFLVVPFSIRTVQAGQVAVVKHLGKIVDVRTAGTHFDLWFMNSYIKYDAKVRTLDAETMAYSSDAQTMDINMTVQYQIITDKVVDIATQYGNLEILQNRIESIAIEKAKSVLSGHKAMDIIANRASISPAVEAAIMEAVGEEYYVNIVTVVLTNIDFSDAFELAVEEKMIAEQAKLKADYENETKIAKAEAEAAAKLKEAQAAIDIAKAKAEALKIEAEAEAEANKIIDASITNKIIEKMLVDAWDGKMPVVSGNGNYMLPSDILGK